MSHRPELEHVEVQMVLADGRASPFVGRGLFRVRLGKEEAVHTVWVADIEPDGILGLDVMRAFGGQIVLRDGQYAMTLDGDQGRLEPSSQESSPSCSRVAVKFTSVVPPHSEVIVPGELVETSGMSEIGVLEPTARLLKSNQLLLARTVVNTGSPTVPLRLLNPTSAPRTIYRDTVAAVCEPVSEVSAAEPAVAMCHPTDSSLPGRPPDADGPDHESTLPSHLVDLAERSGRNLNPQQQRDLVALLLEYKDAFACSPSDLGRTDLVKHRINTGNATPIKQPARRLPMHRRAEAEKHVQQMVQDGIIEPSSSAWASPIVLVKKKNGTTRFCVDYRKLNEVTVKDSYPLPVADSCFDALSGSQWFSTLDLSSGYWQVGMETEDREKTAFKTGSGGLYQFTVMPFGLVNAPATFERLMERVLAGLPWEVCLAYLDDVIIHADSFEAEKDRLREVLRRMKTAGLKLSPKKCNLFQQSVSFLGHVVSGEGLSTDPEKIRAVADWPVPSTVGGLRSFLGLCSYYRRFVKGFSEMARPLHRLTEGNREFVWTEECDEAFRRLKDSLTTATVLKYPSSADPFILDTDASNYGLGAVLSQVQNGEERVVAYYSATLSKAERNYCVTRKELLAVVSAIKRFHHYLYGRQFLVRTDHGALKWLLHFKNPEGQLARWLELLGTYDMKIEHRSGSKHGNADALSRRPCEECKSCDRAEEKEDAASVTNRPSEGTTHQQATDNATSVRGLRPAAKHDVEGAEAEVESWIGGRSAQELRGEQQLDRNLAKLLAWKEEGRERPPWSEVSAENCALKAYWSQWDRLQLRDGVLYRRWEVENGGDALWQLLAPKSLRKGILQELHDAKTAGHLGVTKTVGRVKQRFYWHGCTQDVKDWCRKCDVCAASKKPQKAPRAAMKKYNVGAPLERVALDILGPLPESNSGNKYVLVVADYFTKWTEAYPIPNQEAATVATKVVDEFVARFGVPLQIHSDQGRNFESAVFKEMCAILGVEKTRTTPLHPQSDGMVERYNRTLESMLAKFTSENQQDWDEHLSLLMMSYRTAVHETTGCSPSLMMLGREATMPVDLLMGRPEERPVGTGGCQSDYAMTLRRKMETIHQFAREHLEHETERQKRYYDHRGVHSNRFNRGDPVWLYNPKRKKGRCPKLQNDRYEGPFLVVDRIDDLTYRIQKSAQAKPKIVHHNRLKPYQGENAPGWLARDGAAAERVTSQNGRGVSSGTAGRTTENERPKRKRREPAWMADYSSS